MRGSHAHLSSHVSRAHTGREDKVTAPNSLSFIGWEWTDALHRPWPLAPSHCPTTLLSSSSTRVGVWGLTQRSVTQQLQGGRRGAGAAPAGGVFSGPHVLSTFSGTITQNPPPVRPAPTSQKEEVLSTSPQLAFLGHLPVETKSSVLPQMQSEGARCCAVGGLALGPALDP